MVEVVPAVLETEPALFAQRMKILSSFAPFVHIDVADGRFVPTKTVDAGHVRANMPTVPFILHLMVADPLENLEAWLETGALRYILHCTNVHHVDEALTRIHEARREVALAVHPETMEDDLRFITSRLEKLATVLFVAVVPGFQGGAADERVLDAATIFQHEHPNMRVALDGGLHEGNISRYRNTGITRFVVGSAILDASNPSIAYQELTRALNREL